ncbi:MAG: DegT/DnrJ/EryC1/StrS aminotransferase family protein [Methanobrevibacter millerae]|uniref:DegT/DnrJ/EryC1/StrS aminotransferase family protein n=1 Tax=Methanobrevibacter millerae TaxID=230361 RepID=A0A8T3VS80_9EURY|nr:DegT/DnrJ/EryC1/StrS aminotransferase family protein [Methanobrevibacter millerae]
MMFKFKTPKKETRQIMSDVALGKLNDANFENQCEEKIKILTNAEDVKLTSSGNNSIFVALSFIKGDIIIPDQGGWHGFKQIAKFLGKEIVTLKTDLGLINPKNIDELDISDNSALIFTSFAGYAADQDIKSISRYCKNNGITTIEDASAGIGDEKELLGNCKNSDIVIASTGQPKIINVGSGGFIATNDENIFKESSPPLKLSKTNEIIASGIYEEINSVKENLQRTLNATDYLKKHIDNTIHAKKRGVNLIIKDDDAKQKTWELKKQLPIDKSGFINKCPNYNRVKTKAISIEIKNLDYSCLEKEYLDEIIRAVNNLQQA